MTKQIINLGTADKGNGDPLRTAFDKVNQNFTELYTALGLDAGGINIGSFEFTDNILSTTDSSNIIIDQAVVINSELTVHGDIVPNIANEHNLGSLAKPFKSIYVSGQTVYFNGIPLSVTDDGTIIVNGEVAATPGGALTWDSIVNKPTTTGSQGITATTDVDGNVNIGFSGQLYTGSSSWSFEEIITGEGEEAVVSGKLSLPLITEIAGGDISLTTINLETFNNYSWRFRNDGTLTAPGAIQWDLDANSPGLTDVRINKVGDNLVISTDVILEGPSTWTFTKTGNLNLPRGAVIDTYGDGAGGYTSFSGAPGHYIEVRGKISDGFWSGGMVVHPDGSVDMIAQDGTASASWGFNVDGGLLFPDNSQQTTAWTGSVSSLVNATETFTISATGNVTFSGETGGINRGIVWDYGAAAGGSNSRIRQDEDGLTVRAWTEENLAGFYAAPVRILTNQGDNERIWQFNGAGDLTLPAGGDILDSNGNSVLGGGGSSTTELAYLELTNSPFIIQPVISGTPVTVTSPAQGQGAQVEIVIGEGPVITSVTITSAGTGYAVGQRYRVWFYQIGGNNDDSSIEFEVATVGEAGELLTVTNAAFTGSSLSNIPGTYSGVSIELRSSLVFDEIGPGLTLTRDRGRALYNSELELEYDRNNYTSPLGTEWNSDGWDNLVGFRVRNYTTFRSALNNDVGNNIIGAELIMRDIANNRYYKFSFSVWGENNGAYTYTRTEITDPNFFEKLDYATANNVDVIEDDSTLQIGITRGNNNGIYNPFTEEGWDSDVSPQGTLWNIDGWDDFADVETRTYTNFYSAYGNGGLGNKVPGSQAVMYVPSIEKYYAIQWLRWTQNNAGGGFSYLRYEIDLTKLQEGVRFADGTVQKTAYIPTNVKLRSPGERRIEEAYGYKEVSVTQKITNNLTATLSRNGVDEFRFWVDTTTTTIDEIISDQAAAGITDSSTIQFSLDNTTWYTYDGGTWGDGDERGYTVSGGTVNYSQGDTVYFRYQGGGAPQVWWDKDELPSGGSDFRGAVIDYHAYIPGRGTIVGTIHIVDDDGDEHITHTEVTSGSSSLEYTDLWLVTSEGEIKYRQLDGDDRTLKIQWTAKVFYGSEYYND
jgi:hypothetical protein